MLDFGLISYVAADTGFLLLVEVVRYGAWLLVIDGLAVVAGIARGRLLAYCMVALVVLVSVSVLILLGTDAGEASLALRLSAQGGLVFAIRLRKIRN